MSKQTVEYRVRWTRQGRGQVTRIFQSGNAAYRKVRGILALEAIKDETSFESMPPLEDGPVIEQRQVGPWTPTDWPTPPEVSDGEKRSMLEWAEYTAPKSPAYAPDNLPW